MKCLFCKQEFTPLTVNQKYCSRACGIKYRRLHDIHENYPPIRFNCAQCGRLVETEGGTKDKRTRFCSRSCEKKFWKHPHWENPATRINFSSIEKYEQYERMTNNE